MSLELLTPFEWEALLLSMKVSLVALLWGLPWGILCAWLLARLEFPGKNLLEGLVHLPLVLPPVVTGYLLLILFGNQGPLGQWANLIDLGFGFSWRGAALASMVVSFPLLVNPIRLSIEAVDHKLEEAGRIFGLKPWEVFFKITLPLASTGVLSGAVLAFARSLGEFGATITFVSNIPGETQTLPLALYGQTQIPGGEWSALKLCLLSILLALFALLMAQRIRKKGAR